MKVSEKISEIVDLATSKFAVSDHYNDGFDVSINTDNPGFTVTLMKPTQRQLDSGVVENTPSIRKIEYNIRFLSTANTLMKALQLLYNKVAAADDYDFEE